jgi:hypothetical protein
VSRLELDLKMIDDRHGEMSAAAGSGSNLKESGMATRLVETNGGKVLEVEVSDQLTHADYQAFVPAFERLVEQHGKIRVLFEMTNFHGWQAAALWDDIKFDVKHFSDIERLAMVGDKRWERWMAGFCRPFTTATIRYFDEAAIEEARTWVNADTP